MSADRAGRGMLIAAGALVLAVLASVTGILTTGAAGGGSLVPVGPLVTWGIPVVRAVHHGALLGAIGAAWIVVIALPPPARVDGTRLSGARARLARIGGASALVWAAASIALMLLGAAEALGAGGSGLGTIALSTDLGRTQLAVAVCAAAAGLALLLGRSTVASAWGLALALIGTALLGLAGHAGASLDHTNAVNAMALHLIAMALWAGPLLVMLTCRRLIGEHMPIVVRRFSPWALAAVVALAASGLINAGIRLHSPGELVTTGYGRLVLVKAVLLVAIAGLGALQRRRLGDTAGFRHLALTEAAVLAVVVGASIALGRSAPPVPQSVPPTDEAQRLIGLVGFLPPAPEFSMATLFTQVRPDWVATLVAIAMAGAYVAGVVRLQRRGDRWPLLRTVPFVLGCLALWWVTSGGAAAYGRFRFDAHMVQHMAMMMIVPPLWVLGAPVTLLTRAMAPRTDGTRGVREWVLAVLHSRYSRVISFPPMAGAIFAGSLVLFYFTPLFEAAQVTHVGHVLMTVHFLLAGYLFAWVLIGIDPAPTPLNPVLKLVTLLVTLSFHAFFGVALVSTTWIIAAGWYHALGMYDDTQLALLQRTGGSIMWGVSEIPSLLYAVILAFQWTRSEDRRARQYDRKAARDNDAELTAYNDYLASLKDRG